MKNCKYIQALSIFVFFLIFDTARPLACEFLMSEIPMLQIEDALEKNRQYVKKMKISNNLGIPFASGIPCQHQKFSSPIQMIGVSKNVKSEEYWSFHSWIQDDFSMKIQVLQHGYEYTALTSKEIATHLSDGKVRYAEIAIIDKNEGFIEVPHLHGILLIFDIKQLR